MGTIGRAVELLAEGGIRLTLVDVGSSLESFAPYRPLLGHAAYVAFDPDRREVHDRSDGAGRRVVVDKAVVAQPDQAKATFLLTANPTCSSTLEPLTAALQPWLHAHRFAVVDTVEVAATTLDEAMASIGVDRVDWLKLDTQGTDTRLLRSLSDQLWTGLMAVDAEPGLDAYYVGEDTFAGLHAAMVDQGFWLADLALTTGVRLRRQVFDDHFRSRSRLGRFAYEVTLKRSPMAVGPRYLRTVESLQRVAAPRDDYVRLWACATFSGNHPFALDVAVACQDDHGPDSRTGAMAQLSMRANRSFARRNAWRHAGKLTRRNLLHAVRWR